MGLEALSRGAGNCYFMEHNKTAYRSLEDNVKRLGATNAHLFYGDSFEKFTLVYEMVKRSATKTYFYFDPPFSTRDGMDDIYDKTIALIETIEPQVCEMVVVEHMSNLDMPQNIGTLVLKKRKKFGRSTMTYYLPQG